MKLYSNGSNSFTKAVLVVLAGISLSCLEAMADSYSGGAGTPDDPYLISTSDDLVELSRSSSDWGSHFRMTKDIDMADVKGFTPIAPDTSMEADFQGPKFAGTFNGDGHVISNLVIDSPDQKHLGFFGGAGLGSEIRNLHLQNVMITGNDAVGALVGLVEQGHIFSSSSTGTLQGQIAIGGLSAQIEMARSLHVMPMLLLRVTSVSGA